MVTVSGPTSVEQGGTYTYTARASSGDGDVKITSWTVKRKGSPVSAGDILSSTTGSLPCTCRVKISTINVDPGDVVQIFANTATTSYHTEATVEGQTYPPSITMPSSLIMGVGEVKTVTATFSNMQSWDYSISPTSVATVECISAFNGGATFAITGVSAGTATFQIQYQYNGTKTKKCTVNVRGSTPVDPEEPDLVSSIDIQTPNGTEVQVGKTISIGAFAYPTSADNRRLTATIRSGSQYATISSTSSSTGCSAGVTGVSPGTVVVRITAQDSGGYYDEVTITVIEATTLCTDVFIYNRAMVATDSIISEVDTNIGKTVDVYPGGSPTTATDTTVSYTVRSGASLISVQLISDSVHGAPSLSQYRITGLAEGTAVVRFTANDGSGEYADLTVNVGRKLNDDFPCDYSRTLRLDMFEAVTAHGGNDLGDLLPAAPPYRLHGGYQDVQLPAGIYVLIGSTGDEYSVVLDEESSEIEYDTSTFYLQGAAREPGEVWLYVENAAGQVQRTGIIVEAAGEFTKTLSFDANVPTGSTSTGSVPPKQTLENTAGIANFTIPSCDIAVEGYIFIGWRTVADGDGDGRIYGAGSRFTITGDDVDVVLYAEWFPIPEDATGSGTSPDPFTWVFQTYDVIDITVPNKGDHPIIVCRYDSGELPEGVSAFINGTQYVSFPEGIVNMSSGNVVLSGTPSTVSTLTFYQRGSREYEVYFRLIVAQGEVPAPDEGLVVTFKGNGGTFPNGRNSVTLSVPDRVYTLPDWAVVDRPGYRLSHWTDAGGNRAEMGQQKNTIETWTAQWVADARNYRRGVLHAAVRVYRSLKEYIDLTDMFSQGGEPVVTASEIQPGSASMTVLTDYTAPSRNIMSPDCSLWSSGSDGPVEPGMYVRIDDIGSDGTLTYLFDGFITTISPTGETVSIEAADWLTMLGKMGTAYRRNFYGTSRASALFDAGHDDQGLYAMLTLPAGFSIDGTPQWKVRAEHENTGDIVASVMRGTGSGTASYTFPVDADVIDHLSVHIGYRGNGSMSATLTVRSGQESVSDTRTLTPSTNIDVDWEDWSVGDIALDISGGVVTVEISVQGSGYLYVHYGNNGAGTLVTPTETLTNVDLNMSYGTGVWHDITEYGAPLSDGRMYVSAIDGVTDLSDTGLYTPSEDRARVPYITGSQAVGSIMESIGTALGFTPMTMEVAGGDAELVMFRTGGGYALDYLQKLADTPSALGRRRAFAVRGYTTPVLVPSSRHALSDAPSAHIHYGGDTVTGSNAVAYSQFSPSLTFKHRPNLVMVRGTMSGRGETESVPIMVAVEDAQSTQRRHGLVIESVIADSNVNQVIDAASSAWATLCDNELDEWEGTVVLPGIRRGLLPASGQYAGSGVSVLLTDTRMGIEDERARVREITLDYNACTTTVVLTNHGLVYSSGLSDTTVMARTSADIATGDNSTTLFNTQFVRIVTDTPQEILNSGNTVTGYLSSGTPFSFESVSILQLPNGRSVLVASAPAHGEVHAPDDKPYDVVSVKVNDGVELAIRPSVRPDYYQGQTLIINVDFPTQS